MNTQRIYKPGIISGIKCSSSTQSSTDITMIVASSTTAATTTTTSCNGRCRGSFPYGCNPSFSIGYCNNDGGCISYSAINHPDWCCFQGCDSKTTVVHTLSTSSCDGHCRGPYPYGCNPSFTLGYCNIGGGCIYSSMMNDSTWCCFKGC